MNHYCVQVDISSTLNMDDLSITIQDALTQSGVLDLHGIDISRGERHDS